ncbi:interleukin-1 receptor type 1 [Cynoglossus semilaevis]|uniref:interleukin-1 receptor type 1 n=1 Tax=Cynoglossus semilaevis TaxID=244447 RepID=UPI000D62D5AC|nr:interleukin-1 receptor type 1-like [Cynoglossus semilaevis]
MALSSGWICSLAAFMFLGPFVAHVHSGNTETYLASVGHLFPLRCHISYAHTNVTWSKAGRGDKSLPSGVEVKDGLMWFLPVQLSHNGTYICEKRGENRSVAMEFGLLVSTGDCPDAAENITVPLGVRGGLPCKQNEIFRLNATRSIRWMKDCHQVELLSLQDNGYMRLPAVKENDAGKYTCLIDISLDGRTYTAARSIQLTVSNVEDMIYVEPQLVFPRDQVVMVEVGQKAELRCLAYIGFSKDQGILMYWTVEGNYIEDYEELEEFCEYKYKRGRVYVMSTLSISKVHSVFLNVPIHCNVNSPAGQNVGLVVLKEADHSSFSITLSICLVTLLTLLILAVVYLFFKEDVLLTYRNMANHLSRPAPDGKLYDGYVAFLSENQRSAESANFALQILPRELEVKHGYSLFIRGRDDCPGEAFHDIISDTVTQCSRLIIVLSQSSADSQSEEGPSLHADQGQLSYEQKIGIHDALTRNEPQVILVEIDGPVDYGRLPESLHYIKRKQGALMWETGFLGTNKPTKLYSKRRFWKKLQYHMPSVPVKSLHTGI